MKNFLNKFDTAFGIPLLPKQIAAMNDSNKILIFQSISIIFLLLIFAKFNFFYPFDLISFLFAFFNGILIFVINIIKLYYSIIGVNESNSEQANTKINSKDKLIKFLFLLRIILLIFGILLSVVYINCV